MLLFFYMYVGVVLCVVDVYLLGGEFIFGYFEVLVVVGIVVGCEVLEIV